MKRDQAPTHFGAATARVEDPALLTGRGRFIDDLQPRDLLHAVVVRSTHAHARILAIDCTRARAAPGVRLVLTHADMPAGLRDKRLPLLVPHPSIQHPVTQRPLASDEVCYVGDPVAIVVADERHLAEDAAELLAIDYAPLAVVADLDDALRPELKQAHQAFGSNTVGEAPFVYGDCDAAFRQASHVVRARFEQHRGGAFFMETRGCVVVPDADGESFTFHAAAQGAHRLKRAFVDLFERADHQVRVVVPPDVGGGFGPKGSFYPEYASLTCAALMLQRPLKWIEDRRENFQATQQERDQVWELELAADETGRILGLRGQLIHDNGAYVPWGLVLPWISMSTLQGAYDIPAFSLQLRSLFTNKVPCTPVRGAGRPQAVFAIERLMDLLARQCGLDRAEVRRRNFIQPSQMPFDCRVVGRDGTRVVYDSGDYPATQERALALAGYANFPARQAAARAQGRHIGIGIASFVEATGLGPYEGATLRIATSGRITLYTGAAPQGQSHQTTFAQIAADSLGVQPKDIHVVTGDTQGISQGIGTFAARSAVNAGNAVHLAALALRQKIVDLAARLLSVDAERIVLRDGQAIDGAHPDQALSYAELAVAAMGKPGFALPPGSQPGLEHTSYFMPDQSTYSNGCHVVEAEVDVETGHVQLLRYLVVDDCGRQINPMVVHGQVLGGVVHGIGNALLEQLVHDENGQLLTTNFGEYLLPLASDLPQIEVHHTETPSPRNPLGVKGAGEGGTLPAVAAIASAVEDALSPFGVRITQVPMTPMRIVQWLAAAAP